MQRKGLAKQQFSKTYQRTPWLPFNKSASEKAHSDVFEHYLAQKRLSYIDCDLTQRLLQDYPSVKQEVALFISHLILASREGHLCVQVSQDCLKPSVEQIWQNEEGTPMPADEAKVITQLICAGLQHLPEAIMTASSAPICREGNQFYLQKHWLYETRFLESLHRHIKIPPALAIDGEGIEREVEKLCRQQVILKEQGEAIIAIGSHSLILVTGGPGTGKTYTAGHMIKLFWQLLTEEQKLSCQMMLAAPTGKAAASLQRSLNKAVSSLENFPQLQAKTLHSLLGFRKGSAAREPKRLAADFLVVDESSMIDARLMSALFESLKPGSRLVLLGDQHQLPPVEAGSFFADLIDLQKPVPIPRISLSVCMRSELKEIVLFAQLINQGSAQAVIDFSHRSSQGVKRLHFHEDIKKAQADLVSYVASLYPSIISREHTQDQLIEMFQTVRTLSPMRKGPFGVETLNQLIWQKLSHKTPQRGYIAMPILITSNDYRLELFNGETGILIRPLPLHALTSEDYALFPSRSNDGVVRRFSAHLLPNYELAYCLSVHKSQGSEFDRVILALPEGSEIFGREVFYTAATRARQSLEIYSSDSTIKKTVENQGQRLSGIEQRVQNFIA